MAPVFYTSQQINQARAGAWARRMIKHIATCMGWEVADVSEGIRIRVLTTPYIDMYVSKHELVDYANQMYANYKMFKSSQEDAS